MANKTKQKFVALQRYKNFKMSIGKAALFRWNAGSNCFFAKQLARYVTRITKLL